MTSEVPPGATEAQRLRYLRSTLQQRQAEIAELGQRSDSPSARASYDRAGTAIGRAIAELSSAQVASAAAGMLTS